MDDISIKRYIDEPPLDPKADWLWWWMDKFGVYDREWAREAWIETAIRGK